MKLTKGAQLRFDDYMDEFRACLENNDCVDAYEIEEDIIEYIENELADKTGDVSVNELEAVLSKLGTPEQWLSDNGLVYSENFETSEKAPKTAYISFILFMILFWPDTNIIVKIFLLILSFAFARHDIQNVRKKQTTLQKWLTYPALIMFYLIVFCVIFLWPLIPSVISSVGLAPHKQMLELLNAYINSPMSYVIKSFIYIRLLSIWWCLCLILILIRPNLIKNMFFPFANNLKRRLVLILFYLTITVAVIALAATIKLLFS